MMTQPLEEIAEANAGRFGVAKLNVDENQTIATSHGVLSIPTMIVFAEGIEKKRLVGARSKAQLEREIYELSGVYWKVPLLLQMSVDGSDNRPLNQYALVDAVDGEYCLDESAIAAIKDAARRVALEQGG